jgi:hypothetical protein
MQITVTNDHINRAKPLPCSSPVALALKDMGIEAIATHRYVYHEGNAYQLPQIATTNEIAFDMAVRSNGNKSMLMGYSFELPI